MDERDQLLREEQSVYMEHRDDFKEYTALRGDAWLERIFGPDADEQDAPHFPAYARDLEGSIRRDPELMKLYVASSVTLALERGRRELLPEESLERVKRQVFVKLAGAKDEKEIEEISGEAAAKIREIYLRYRMSGYSYPVKMAVEEVHRSRFKEVSAGKIAAEIGVNASYLSRIFKKETGKTLTEYITSLKMETAKELMLGHLYSLTEIAEMLGYHSYTYFSRTFRKYSGTTPEKYSAAAPGQQDGGK